MKRWGLNNGEMMEENKTKKKIRETNGKERNGGEVKEGEGTRGGQQCHSRFSDIWDV